MAGQPEGRGVFFDRDLEEIKDGSDRGNVALQIPAGPAAGDSGGIELQRVVAM
jgi:hypothetical protein